MIIDHGHGGKREQHLSLSISALAALQRFDLTRHSVGAITDSFPPSAQKLHQTLAASEAIR